MLKFLNSKTIKLKHKKDTKKHNMTSNKETLKNKNTGLNILWRTLKKSNKNMKKISKKKYHNQNKLKKEKRLFEIKWWESTSWKKKLKNSKSSSSFWTIRLKSSKETLVQGKNKLPKWKNKLQAWTHKSFTLREQIKTWI